MNPPTGNPLAFGQPDLLYTLPSSHIPQQTYEPYSSYLGFDSPNLPAQSVDGQITTSQSSTSHLLNSSLALHLHPHHNAESFRDIQATPAIPMGPPTKTRKRKAPTLRADNWEPYKVRIVELHITQGLPLREVKKKIEEESGFIAELRQYRTRISQWGMDKNVKPNEMSAVVKKRQQRKIIEVNKRDLVFHVRGHKVDPQKIDRWMKRHEVPESLLYVPSPAESTPSAVHCRTISDCSSPTQSPMYSAQTPSFSSADIMSIAHSLAYFSPVPLISGIVRPQNSIFTGQSPAPINTPSPVSIAASATTPTSAHSGLYESTFTGQSPAPFSVPSTPQACNLDLLPNETVGDRYNKHNAHTPATAWNIACELERQGRYNKAERMHRLALRLKENLLGHEHPDTLASMGKLALVLEIQGRYRAAEQIERQTLQLSQRVLGLKHPDTLTSMGRLALVLERQGRYRAAERMGRQALELSEKVLGSEHPDVLTSMRTLALVLEKLGRYNAAEKIGRQALELRQKILGAEHPDTLMSMSSLAWVLGKLGRYWDAEQMGRQALELRQKVLGPEHPRTLESMNNVVCILSGQGKYVEADKMGRQTLECRQKVLGPEHPHTQDSMDNLAVTLYRQGQYVEAEKIQRQTVELSQKVLGPEHPHTQISIRNLAVTLNKQGQYVEAEKIQRQTVELSQKVLGL